MGFQQGLSGLNASSKSLEVIGNNIANASTVGAKVARAEFADVYANAIGGSNAVGIGVTVADVAQQFTQGNISTTDNPLDIAINGNGFFQVSKAGVVSYSRNGQFKIDRDGFIVNDQQQHLMGYPADATGTIIPGAAGPLQMPTGGITPAVTTTIGMEMNLDARLAVTLPGAGAPIDFADPTTYNNATSQTVYDAKGQGVALTYYFQKASTDTWNVYVAANGAPIATSGGNPAASTTITFPANGGTPTAPVAPVAIDIPSVSNAAGAVTVPITGVAARRLEGDPVRLAVRRHRPGAGRLRVGPADRRRSSRATASSWRATRTAQTKPAGQIEIASFRNPQGLQPLGGNAWGRSFASGDPLVGVPGDGNLGVLQAGARRGVEHRPDGRARRHDHRAARLPGQRADDQDAGPDPADDRQPPLAA